MTNKIHDLPEFIKDADIHIAHRIAYYREVAEFTIKAFYEGGLRVSYQQGRKYEARDKIANGDISYTRVKASTLYYISHILEIPIQDFFPIDAGFGAGDTDITQKLMLKLADNLRKINDKTILSLLIGITDQILRGGKHDSKRLPKLESSTKWT